MIETGVGHRLRSGSPAALRIRSGHRGPGQRLGLSTVLSLVLSGALLASGCGPEGELREPVPLFEEVPIEYPLSLWDQEVEGTTLLRVWVSEGGSVDSTRVLESSGHEAFDSAAVQGGRQLRFEPASRNGEPVAVWAEVPVHFSLDGARSAGGSAAETSSDPSSGGSSGSSGGSSAAADEGGSGDSGGDGT